MSYSSLLDTIKDHPISSIIGNYIPVTRSGANFKAVCPFHSDTHPSLMINDSKKIYKCFACGASGDHVTFVEEYKNLDFKEAIKEIAGVLGLPIDDLDRDRVNPKLKMAFRVLTASQKIYRKVSMDMKPADFEQFKSKRGLTEEIATQFGLGFAPKNNMVSHYLETIPEKERKKAIDMAKEIGLIRVGKQGEHYDTFRERIIFPIWDQSGQVRGFGSRATKDYQKAKYLNSQESFAFNKRNILYGLHLAKNHIRQKDSVILTEGYMDTIALHQNGFQNSVALMGVAISDNAIKMLTPMTKNFYLSLDSDNAGFSAMERMNAQLLEHGILAKYLNFEPFNDPDEFLLEKGRLAMAELLEKAPTFIDVLIESKIPDFIPETSDGKLALLHKVFDIISPLKEDLRAIERLISTAKRLGLQSDSSTISEAYRTFLQSQKDKPSKSFEPKTKEIEEIYDAETMPSPEELSQVHHVQEVEFQPTEVEKIIITQLILHPDCMNQPKWTEILDFVTHSEVQNLITQIGKLYLEIDESEYITILHQYLLNADHKKVLKEIVSSALFQYKPIKMNFETTEKLVKDLITKIKIADLKLKRNQLKTEQVKTQTMDEANILLQEILKIEKQLNELKNAHRAHH
jgi:DNA primase